MKRHVDGIHKKIFKTMKGSAILIFLIAFTLTSSAQKNPGFWSGEDCAAKLRNAEELFQAGLFNNSIEILEKVLDSCTLERSDKLLALELLAKSYVEIDDPDNADAIVNLLLINYPHYELIEAENPELYNRLVRKYTIHPRFTIGVKNTGNWLRHRIIRNYSVLEGLDYSQPFNESGYWFTYYGVAEYEFDHDISVSIDGMFFWTQFYRSFSKAPGFDLSYSERDEFLELPVYLKKYFHPGKNLLAYASAGAGILYMTKAYGDVSLTYTKDDVITGTNTDFKNSIYDIDVTDMRNRVTYQWNAGVGFGYKLKNLRMFLDARYIGGMGSITVPEKSDLHPELHDVYFYIDNEIKINQFEVGATITYTLFNSVKRIRK